jgi:hypothetical protein
MNEIFELWSLPWHLLQRSLANELRPVCGPVDPSTAAPTAPLSLSWLARARAPVQVVATRGR